MQVDQVQYEKFLKFQVAAEAKNLASKRWNAKLRILANKALEAGLSVSDDEIEKWINEKREVNL